MTTKRTGNYMEGEARITMKDISILLGLSPQAMRNYEKINDTARHKINENGYREFPFESVSQLIAFRQFATIGVPLREISKIMDSSDSSDLDVVYSQQGEAIDREIKRLQVIQDCLGTLRRLVWQIPRETNRFKLVTSPEMYRLPCEKDDKILSSGRDRALIRDWASQLPITFYLPTVEGPPFSEQSVARIGLGIEARHADYVSIPHGQVVHLPSIACVGGVVCVHDAPTARNNPRYTYGYYPVIEEGLAQVRRLGLRVTGNILTRLIVSNVRVEDGSSNDYYYAWYPVE
jgi:DNA-binding transcriptional MerR regulator